MRQRGAELVVVGSGQPEEAARFARASGLGAAGVRILVDPSLETYRVAGMRRGLKPSLGLVTGAVRALRGGHMQGRTQGDALQLGGVVVVAPGGVVRLRHANRGAEEMVPLDEVLARLDAR